MYESLDKRQRYQSASQLFDVLAMLSAFHSSYRVIGDRKSVLSAADQVQVVKELIWVLESLVLVIIDVQSLVFC